MRQVEYRLLGPVQVLVDGADVALGRAHHRAILAILGLSANRVVHTDELIEALWPEAQPGRPQTAIQTYVSALRKTVGRDAIQTAGGGYALHVESGQLDLEVFESLSERARQLFAGGDAHAAAAVSREALELWRGPPLAEFRYEPFAQQAAARLEELRLACLELRIDAELASGAGAELVGELDSLVAEHPLRERLRGQQMRALYRAGRQGDALESYRGIRDALVEELGVDPGPDLQELQHAILRQDQALAPARPAAASRTRLPEPATALIGRERELEVLVDLLRDPAVRLVTLTGPGGIGKTRLALAVASALAESRTDGAWYVDLSAVRDPALVGSTVALTVTGRDEIDGALAGKQLLLVLDNFEQLLPAALDLAELLRLERGVTLLVTSREPLRLESEHEYAVPPLADADAVALFTQRARAVSSSFEPDDRVAEICRRLDGLPLAVQLAAARTKALTPTAILARLDRRLSLLTQGSRDLPERQQTLQGTIAWSYDLLDDDERRGFEALSVFDAGFSIDAARDVAEVDLDLLARLLDKSLLRASGEDRFRLLETIREYAADRLDEHGASEDVRRRHAGFYLALAERLAPGLDGPEQGPLLHELDLDHANMRLALTWALDRGDDRLYGRLAEALGLFWKRQGHLNEGRRWLGHALDREPPSELRADLLFRDGTLALGLGALDHAAAAFSESIDLYRAYGDARAERLGKVMNNLGVLRMDRGEYQAAAVLFDESLHSAEAAGDEVGVASAQHNLGMVALASGDFDGARAVLEDCLALARKLDHTWGCALTLNLLGATFLGLGETRRAADAFAEALQLARGLDDAALTVEIVGEAAGLPLGFGDPLASARLLGAARALREEVELSAEPWHLARLEGVEARLRELLDEDELAAACATGASLDLAAAIQLASSVVRPVRSSGSS